MSKLESAADGMQNMTKSFSGEDFTKLLGPMTDMIKDNQPRIASILSNLDSVTTGINKGEGTLGRLLRQDTLYVQTLQAVTNLIASTEDLKITLSTTRQMMADMNSGKGTIGRLLVEALFDYDREGWYSGCSPPVPPPIAQALPASRELYREIAELALARFPLGPNLASKVKGVLQGLGRRDE
jgi:hypothetical protein